MNDEEEDEEKEEKEVTLFNDSIKIVTKRPRAWSSIAPVFDGQRCCR